MKRNINNSTMNEEFITVTFPYAGLNQTGSKAISQTISSYT